ncbi:nucleotide excision repair homolog [Octopus vulgaris]|nr:nucleotide excision repair homolog [Octopus vulgaris]
MAASSTWSNIVENYLAGVNDSAASQIAIGLTNKEVNLLEIVQCLGSALTTSGLSRRADGTKLLCDALHQIPQDLLIFAEVELLCTFLCNRLGDHHSLQPAALHGLAALSKCCNVPSTVPEKLCRRIFREVQCPSLAQKDRYSVYSIIYNFLVTKLDELRKMEGDFVCGFIQAMDGEKDPRNLQLAFQCAEIIIRQLSLGLFVEEMFEITACYFPIDFQPPADNPHGIEKEDLVLSLRRCLTATPSFAEFVLPLLFDKLSSDVPDSRIDAMQTLAEVSPVYGAEALNKYLSLNVLFSILRNELISGSIEAQEAALKATQNIASTLTDQIIEDDRESPLNSFLNYILKVCRLNSQQEEQFVNHMRLLHSAASASKVSAIHILQEKLPELLEMSEKACQSNWKVLILRCIHGFLEATKSLPDLKNEENPVSQHLNKIFAMFTTCLSNSSVSLCLISVKCLALLLDYHDILDPDKKSLIMQHILIVMSKTKDEILRSQCISTLSEASVKYPEIIQQNVLPALFQILKNGTRDNISNQSHQININSALEVFSSICMQPSVTKAVLPEIWIWLENLVKGDPNRTSNVSKLFHEGMESLLKITIINCSDHPFMCPEYFYSWLLPRLLKLNICHLVESEVSSTTNSITDCTSSILREISTRLDKRKGEELSEQMIRLFLHEDLSVFDISASLNMKFCPLKPTSVKQTRLIGFLMAVICSLLPEVSIDDLEHLLEQLADLALQSKDQITRTAAAKCFAGLINKHGQASPGKECLDHLQEQLKDKLMNKNNSSGDLRAKALHLWLWITKALLISAHSEANNFVGLVFNLLSDEELGEAAAEGMFLILSEYKDVLSQPQHAKIRIMYKQRLFIENVQHLSKSFHEVKSELKKNYLIAVSHLLTFLPHQVLVSKLPPLVPMLVLALMFDDNKLQMSTMATMKTVLDESPNLLAQHVNLVVPKLIKLSETNASMKVRIASLECLENLTQLPTTTLLPYRREVIRALGPVLDDKKRLVRKQAVKARGEW